VISIYITTELSTQVYRNVLSHFVDMEERKEEIIDEFYKEHSVLRDNFIVFIDNYLRKLEELIRMAQIIGSYTNEKFDRLNYLPYVIIGSEVDIEGVNDLNEYTFKIILPHDKAQDECDNCISCMSSLGKSLLLKEPGDKISMEINREVRWYKIKSIRF